MQDKALEEMCIILRARLNEASLRDMMHLLRKYDAAHFIRNDAMHVINPKKYTFSDAIHAARDYIRLAAITYRSFGLSYFL